MMKQILKNLIIVGIVITMLASAAIAQIDPDPDGIGLYADLAATQTSISVAPFTEFEVYLVATNISEEDIVIWGTEIGWDPGLLYMDHSFPYGNIDNHIFFFGTDEADMAIAGSDYSILAYGPNAHLLTISFLFFDNIPHYLYLRPFWYGSGPDTQISYGSKQMHDAYEPNIPLHPSSGSFDLPVFVVNGDAPVESESMSFGQVKRLYR